MHLRSQSTQHQKSFVREIPLSVPDYILLGIVLISLLMYLGLLLTGTLPTYIVAFIPVIWLLYWLKNCSLCYSTPLDFALIGLLILATLGAVFSPDLT